MRRIGHSRSIACVPNLPRPLPDELLYSVIARSAVHIGYRHAKAFLRALYQGMTKPACPDLPGSLTRLVLGSQGAWGITAEDLALRHTLLPYYTHFLDEERKLNALNFLLAGQSHAQLRLGISASGVRPIQFFRLCPDCVATDSMTHGETYWRRSHHIPGVFVCAQHGVPLVETTVRFRPAGRYDHVYAHPGHLAGARPVHIGSEHVVLAQKLAAQSVRMLDASGAGGPQDYRAALRAHGFIGKRGAPARFGEAVRRLLPEYVLTQMFTSLNAEGSPTWLDKARRKPRSTWHPLKHVLVQVLLETHPPRVEKRHSARLDLRGKSLEPDLRRRARDLAAQGLSTRAIAQRLRVAWETADRLLKPLQVRAQRFENPRKSIDREAWRKLRNSFPRATRTQLRRKAPALYARLYRADKTWLMALVCAPAVRTPKPRLDWNARDAEFAARVEAEADRLLSLTPPQRATRSKILAALAVEALFDHYKEKLPRTQEALARRAESVEVFQVRRLAAVLDQEGGANTPDWMLLRRARINTSRFPDGGAHLVSLARRRFACM